MTEEDLEFAALMEQLRAGDEEAAWKLLEVYGPAIRRVIRHELHEKMRSKFDSVDFVQAVWASFFRQPSQFRRLQKPDELMAFLVTVAQHKVVDETRRRFNTQKWDVTREESLDDPEVVDAEAIPSTDPRPSQVAMFHEQWDQLVHRQPRENRKILEMRFAGATYEEIGVKLGIHERTARKIVDDVLEQMQRE